MSFNKCARGRAMASNGNINRGIQLIVDVIDYKMLKGKYLVSMLSTQPMRLHDYGTYTERRSASESCIIDNTHCIVFSF